MSDDVSREHQLILSVKSMVPTAVSGREIENKTVEDEELEGVKRALKSGNWSRVDKSYERIRDQICQVGELLLKQDRIIPPR